MIDLGLLRDDPDYVVDRLKRRDPSFKADQLLELDKRVRQVRHQVEELRHEKNELAKSAQGGISPEVRERSIACGKQLKEREAELIELERSFRAIYLSCPNIPADDLPDGGKENNRVMRQVGDPPSFSFEPKHHVELGQALGWFDFEAAARIAASNFAFYKRDAVNLTYTLATFMLKNNIRHGFEPMLPSVIVNEHSLEVTGNFPKSKEQVYRLADDDLYLTPTAEVNLANYYREQIFTKEELPIRNTAWTSCFRREAGAYGAHERGLIRIHQFEKVELYTLCEPEKSADELDHMVACAEDILKALGLHYRISLLAAQDVSFASAKTYDIEVWLPGQKEFYEVSSCSNCTDFQARRGLMRYRSAQEKGTQLVHTLNGSSLALPRLMVALMETYQQEDGTIALPAILQEAALF